MLQQRSSSKQQYYYKDKKKTHLRDESTDSVTRRSLWTDLLKWTEQRALSPAERSRGRA